MSDTNLIMGIVLVFVLLGTALPFVNDAFNVTSVEFSAGGIEDDISGADVSATDVFFSIFAMFFWTFGSLPFWLDAIFIVFRIMLAWLIVRVIRGVGG